MSETPITTRLLWFMVVLETFIAFSLVVNWKQSARVETAIAAIERSAPQAQRLLVVTKEIQAAYVNPARERYPANSEIQTWSNDLESAVLALQNMNVTISECAKDARHHSGFFWIQLGLSVACIFGFFGIIRIWIARSWSLEVQQRISVLVAEVERLEAESMLEIGEGVGAGSLADE